MANHHRQLEHNQQILELISKVCVHLHQNKDLQIGEDEASLRISLQQRLEACGMNVKREIAYTLIYEDMDQRENERIYLTGNDTVVIDVRAVDSLGDYHRDQLQMFLAYIQRPVGLLVNFGKHLFEPEIIAVGNNVSQ